MNSHILNGIRWYFQVYFQFDAVRKDMGDRYISDLTQCRCLNHTYIQEIRDVNRNGTVEEHFKFDQTRAECYNILEEKWKTVTS